MVHFLHPAQYTALMNSSYVSPKGIAISNSSLHNMTTSAWSRMYETKYVTHGDLYISVDAWVFGTSWNSTSHTPYLHNIPDTIYLGDFGFNSFTVPVDQYEASAMPPISWPHPVHYNAFDRRSIRGLFNVSDSGLVRSNIFGSIFHTPYGASTEIHDGSRVLIALPLMVIVVVCNTIKAIVMLVTLRQTREFPLVTIGDALASFLRQPDEVTTGMCVLHKEDLIR